MIITITPGSMVGHFLRVTSHSLPSSISLNQAVTVATGKAINVSRAATAFGAPTLALGCHAGFAGRHFVELLRDEGIPYEGVEAQGETRTGIYIMAPDGTLLQEITDERFSAGPDTEERLLDLIKRRISGARFVVCSGRIPPGFSASFFDALTEASRREGARCVIDARGPLLKRVLHNRPFMIKPNEQELADFAGEPLPDDLAALAAFCRNRFDVCGEGPENVLLSLGPRGAILITPAEAWHVSVGEAVTGNAIGCGDTLVGGALSSLMHGHTLIEAVRRGVAAATSNLASDSPGAVLLDLFHTYLERTRAERLER